MLNCFFEKKPRSDLQKRGLDAFERQLLTAGQPARDDGDSRQAGMKIREEPTIRQEFYHFDRGGRCLKLIRTCFYGKGI